jgi:glycerol-3-phosphate dehydrogenase
MSETFDLIVIGGGINGCGIASDASLRGMSVLLCEQNDLASATSSASSKLIHGGLRYLENFHFKLVKKALDERQILLNTAPHLINPLKFIMPITGETRKAWFLNIGLFIYDNLSLKNKLPRSKSIKNNSSTYLKPLKKHYTQALSYYDCITNDARLTLINALQAKSHGASIRTHTKFIDAKEIDNIWQITLKDKQNNIYEVKAKSLINATGPWVEQLLNNINVQSPYSIELVKGSHIVINKLYLGNQAYILQNNDGRIVFVIPYNGNTLIGTTETSYKNDISNVSIDENEIDYLCNAVNYYFKERVSENNIIDSWSGVRPLLKDKSKQLKEITRDYKLCFNSEKAPILSVFGGKITTYRKLSEDAVTIICNYFGIKKASKTASTRLPGSISTFDDFNDYLIYAKTHYSWLPKKLLERYLTTYGTLTEILLKDCNSIRCLGENFGFNLFSREIDYLINQEWACCIEDILDRRTQLSLHFDDKSKNNIKKYLKNTHNL